MLPEVDQTYYCLVHLLFCTFPASNYTAILRGSLMKIKWFCDDNDYSQEAPQSSVKVPQPPWDRQRPGTGTVCSLLTAAKARNKTTTIVSGQPLIYRTHPSSLLPLAVFRFFLSFSPLPLSPCPSVWLCLPWSLSLSLSSCTVCPSSVSLSLSLALCLWLSVPLSAPLCLFLPPPISPPSRLSPFLSSLIPSLHYHNDLHLLSFYHSHYLSSIHFLLLLLRRPPPSNHHGSRSARTRFHHLASLAATQPNQQIPWEECRDTPPRTPPKPSSTPSCSSRRLPWWDNPPPGCGLKEGFQQGWKLVACGRAREEGGGGVGRERSLR